MQIMLKDRYHLGSGDGAPVASYLKSVHEVLKYCVFDWDYKLGGTAKMMASAVGTEGADGVALLVSRWVGVIDGTCFISGSRGTVT